MNTVSLDPYDLALLAALQADGRSTHQQLADRVHLSPSQVGRRLAKLEADGVIERNVAIIAPASVGRTLTIVALVQVESEQATLIDDAKRSFAESPEVQQCYSLAGEWDYLVILCTTGVAHCREVADRLFMDEGNIKRYETRMVFDVVKSGLQVPTRVPLRRRK